MNTNYTQVNIDQLKTLITSMSKAQGSCSNALKNFTNVMNELISSGQIEGKAIGSLEHNMQVIKELLASFDDYCTTVTKNLNDIITEELDIESTYSNQYNDLLSVNPEQYNG